QSQRDLPRNTPLDRVEVLVTNGNPSRVNIKQLCVTNGNPSRVNIKQLCGSALVPKQLLGMNLAALWHQQSFVLLQTRSSTSQGDMSHHKDIYDNPSLTKKVFANMKKVGASFSGVVTELFDTMLVPATEEVGQIQDNVQSTTIPTEPSTFKPHKKNKSKKEKPQAPKVPSPAPSPKHMLPSPSNDSLPDKSKVIDIKSSSKERIEKLEGMVAKLEEVNRVLKELHSVHYTVDTDEPNVAKEKSFKQGRIIAEIDEDVKINLEEAQAKLCKIDLEHLEKVLSMQDVNKEEPNEVEEVLEVVNEAKLMTDVVTTAGATTTAEAPKVIELSFPSHKHTKIRKKIGYEELERGSKNKTKMVTFTREDKMRSNTLHLVW
nr:hypothetical protein [Tanacetum cinerariifolium]